MTENEAIKILGNTTLCSPLGQAAFRAIESIKELQQFREIGTVEECREAVEKQKPKAPTFDHMLGNWEGRFRCPVCGKVILHDCRDTQNTFCEKCGQAIRWAEDLEETEDDKTGSL